MLNDFYFYKKSPENGSSSLRIESITSCVMIWTHLPSTLSIIRRHMRRGYFIDSKQDY